MGRSNREERDGMADNDVVKRGLGSLRNRRQQLEDAIDAADPPPKKKKKAGEDEEESE